MVLSIIINNKAKKWLNWENGQREVRFLIYPFSANIVAIIISGNHLNQLQNLSIMATFPPVIVMPSIVIEVVSKMRKTLNGNKQMMHKTLKLDSP